MNKPDYLISTPENVDLHLELAGLGNRIYAAAMDQLVIFLAIIVMIVILGLGLFGLESFRLPKDAKTFIDYAVICIGVFAIFLIAFGYFIYFEGMWHGQTPGKKLAGIRVIESSGQPVSWASVLIRNLLRVIDQSLFAVGVLPMMIGRNERRFGDLAAGTLVIRERTPSLGPTVLSITAEKPADSFADVGQITPDEYQLLLTFLKRRTLMSINARERLAKNLSEYFHKKLAITSAWDAPEITLEQIYLAYSGRAQASD